MGAYIVLDALEGKGVMLCNFYVITIFARFFGLFVLDRHAGLILLTLSLSTNSAKPACRSSVYQYRVL